MSGIQFDKIEIARDSVDPEHHLTEEEWAEAHRQTVGEMIEKFGEARVQRFFAMMGQGDAPVQVKSPVIDSTDYTVKGDE